MDLIVEFTDRHDIVDLLTLQDKFEELLTVRVDVVDARGGGGVLDHAQADLDDSPQGWVLRNNGWHILIQAARVAEKLPGSGQPALSGARARTRWKTRSQEAQRRGVRRGVPGRAGL